MAAGRVMMVRQRRHDGISTGLPPSDSRRIKLGLRAGNTSHKTSYWYMNELSYNDRLKQLGLLQLKGRRIRSDLIETFKIVNRKYDINPELFFQL